MAEQGDENTFTRDHIENVLTAFEDGDVVAASEIYAEDGVFIDRITPNPSTAAPMKFEQR